MTAPADSSWRDGFGARPDGEGTSFRVWAPKRRQVELVIETPGRERAVELARQSDGCFAARIDDLGAGDLYRYRLDGHGPYPDPASRFQPRGVHGPSEIVEPRSFAWADGDWVGLRLAELVVYELHVGTFAPEGTFAGVGERLNHLVDLGVTAIELMPVADFPGQRNWGYDGVSLFAPARCYGRPDDLRALVDLAHRAGLGVLLDVVYNHFGPDGAYHGAFSPSYYSRRHRTPWGQAINLDGEGSRTVRDFFIDNAVHWVREYHIDGLRIDATHALVDASPRHFLAELTDRVRSRAGRPVLLTAEDHRNLAHMSRPERDGGWGLDAVWSDDFHHQMRRALAGDDEGYYRDFSGTAADIVETVRRGWFFCGQRSTHLGEPRGTDPNGLPPRAFVIFLQNHDQVGNRAFGDRLHHAIDSAAYRAATALLLCSPETPLLFMGQEWAASTPFLFFTDHKPELGEKVTEGRRREFRSFRAFADPESRRRIPDPQAESTFAASRLAWPEIERASHASVLRLHRALLHLRRAMPALRSASWEGVEVGVCGERGLWLRRAGDAPPALYVAVWLEGAGEVEIRCGEAWRVLLTTEDAEFAPDPQPIDAVDDAGGVRVRFSRPGAALIRVEAIL